MGGEGVDWVSHAMFTQGAARVPEPRRRHLLPLGLPRDPPGDRGQGTNITYKILFNDAVAMTGGQPVDGIISVDAIARQVEAEGVKQVVVRQRRHRASTTRIQRPASRPAPSSTTAPSSTPCSARLREMPGVTVLIYEQTCAAEKRRRRKKGELVDPARRLFINERGLRRLRRLLVQSNCVAVLPLETDARAASARSTSRAATRTTPARRASARASSASMGGELEEAPARSRRGARRASRAASTRCRCPAPHALDRPVRPARHRRRRHRRRHGRRADRDGRAPRRQVGQRARLHGLRAEGRLGAVVRAPRRRARAR